MSEDKEFYAMVRARINKINESIAENQIKLEKLKELDIELQKSMKELEETRKSIINQGERTDG